MKRNIQYRAHRRNAWRIANRETKEGVVWMGVPNYIHAKERWAWTDKARKAVALFMASHRHRRITQQEVASVLAEHWTDFRHRSRCISRLLRELEVDIRKKVVVVGGDIIA
jgi:hypothetical protein